jgi:hypothetical protein
MNGLIILLLVGIVMMMAGAIKRQGKVGDSMRRAVLAGEDRVEGDPNIRIVYKYLPQDIDTFYRVGDHNVPSKLYAPIFSEDSEELRPGL